MEEGIFPSECILLHTMVHVRQYVKNNKICEKNLFYLHLMFSLQNERLIDCDLIAT